MPIRPATWADLPTIARVHAAAFSKEALFGQTMHPYQTQYPDDMQLYFFNRFRSEFFDPRARFVVAYTIDANSGAETVVGAAKWERQGDAPEFEEPWLSPWWVARHGMAWWGKASERWWPNRASEPANMQLLQQTMHHTKHYWQTPERKENWYLDLLGVDPSCGGKGHGKELVKWGLARAKEEGVAASVVSSEENEKFYQRCGYGRVVGWAYEGEGNLLAEKRVPGGAIMFFNDGDESREDKPPPPI